MITATSSSPIQRPSTSQRQAPLCSTCQASARPVAVLSIMAVGRIWPVDQVEVLTAARYVRDSMSQSGGAIRPRPSSSRSRTVLQRLSAHQLFWAEWSTRSSRDSPSSSTQPRASELTICTICSVSEVFRTVLWTRRAGTSAYAVRVVLVASPVASSRCSMINRVVRSSTTVRCET